ncbi:MAG: TIR domain-containing protein [Sphingomonas sp.]|nr:TIR domain-containing protein [Sphingomonas sp.]
MATLFLSYSREDADRVGLLAAALKRAGHTVWWDQHISGGEEFSGAIEEALEAAEVVVVVWTAASIRSAWVRDEAASGRDRGRLVPVTFDGSAPPLGFRQYQTIDLSSWTGRAGANALAPLKQAIVAKAGASPGQSRPVKAGAAPSSERRRWPVSWAAAAALLILLLGGALLYPQIASWARPGGITPKVALGQFALVSANLPGSLPAMIAQEVVAGFGAENAVAVVAPGTPSSSASAPFVMDGSIGRLGDSIRYTVNLKNQSSGVVVWSHAYDHEASDAHAPRQVAVAASQIIRCGLWGASSYRKIMSDQALALYFQWCNEHWSGSGKETAELDAARRVTVAVPDFSFGWSALALAAVPLSHGSGSAEANQIRTEATAAAKKSIALDKHNPEGYMALAGLLPSDRYGEREELLTKAISVRPTECGCERQAYGDFLSSVGRMEEAAEQYERARAMRPLAPFSNLRFAQALYVVGRNDEADRILSDTLELWPDATSLRLLKIKSALWTKRYDEAVGLLQAVDLPLTSDQRVALVAAFEALKTQDAGQRGRAVAELERFALDPRRNDRVVVAALAALGAREAALRAATNLMRSRGLFHAEILFEPNLAAARQESGYADLVQNIGLTAYWRSRRHAPDICRGPAKPPFCSLA